MLELSPFQYNVQVDIDGHNLHYLLTVDDAGQLYDAKAMIFELPTASRKLILGEIDGQLEHKISAYAGLFKYLVPLALAGKVPTYHQQLAPLVEEINQRLQEKGLEWAKLDPAFLSDSFTSEVLKSYGENEAKSDALQACWDKIIAILEKRPPWPSEEVKFLGLHHAEVAVDFFPAIIPFYALSFQAEFYDSLKNVQAEGLSIYDSFLDFYARLGTKEDYISTILNFIKHYPLQKATQDICLEILALNDPHSAPLAVEILLSTGMAEEEIVKLQVPFFKSGNPKVSYPSFSIFAQHISGKHLPDAAEVLEVYVKELIGNERVDNVRNIAALAVKTKMHLLGPRLYDLLWHENRNVQFGILVIINGYFEEDTPHFFDFLTPKMIDRYWELAVAPGEGLSITAIQLLGKIGILTNRANYIDRLVEIGRNAEADVVKVEAIKAINFILRRVPYQRQIEPFYLACLQHWKEEVWAYYVFQGLRFSPNSAFKTALWEEHKNHPNPEARTAANNLFKPTYRRWIDLFIRIWNLLNRILHR